MCRRSVVMKYKFNSGRYSTRVLVSMITLSPKAPRRHNFEFDQKYSSNFITVSWRYPINSYLETGPYFSHSLNASLLLLEAESTLFDSEKPEIRGPSVSELIQHVKVKVVEESGQTPIGSPLRLSGMDDGGEFVFGKKGQLMALKQE
jgi:hypothetical protein